MASNEIAILDPAATVDKLNKIAADRAVNRRRFIAALGITGAAAGAGLLSGCANTTTTPISTVLGAGQTDILNFVLNIEYLQATLFAYLTTGADMPAAVTANSGPITGTLSAPVVFTGTYASQIADLLNEVYFDDLNHVFNLRNILGSAAISRPAIYLANFGAITATNALSIARLLKDLALTAYAGAVTGISTSNATYIGQILGAESFHSGALRLISIQNPTIAADLPLTDGLGYDVPPADIGTGVATTGPTASGGFFPTSGGATSQTEITTGMGYARTIQQVLQVLYGTSNTAPAPHGSFSGGFFPNGVNGNITTS